MDEPLEPPAAPADRGGRWTLPMAGVLGVAVGLGVFLFERIVTFVLEHVRTAPTPWMVIAPGVGLALTAAVLRIGPTPRSRSTADEYLLSYHDPGRRISPAQLAARMSGAVTTLALGGSLGLEGPAVMLGAGTADTLSGRISRKYGIDHRAMLVAGAAAAVAAVFKAPATGAVFALEVPYRSDLARRQLMPALVGAAAGYLSLVSVAGTERLFAVVDNPPFDLRDLGGALVLGVAAGLLARVIARSVRWAKHWAASTTAMVRLPVAVLATAGAAWAALELTDAPLGIGPGYLVLDWLQDPRLAVGAVVAMLAIRFVGVIATTAGGGIGGFFIPLVVLGALLGRTTSALLGTAPSGLFPVLGVAAVLGAGYQVPLAAVMFVAETSGRAGYVVPALLAAVAADLAVGHESVTDFQRDP
jgi:CIC family chloride channel protein